MHRFKDHKKTGLQGEQIAVDFLRKNGYEILAVNWRWRHHEIDIIAKQQEMLVIVEVKTRSSTRYGMPEESVTERKQEKLVEAAEAYIASIQHKGEVRFDVVAVFFSRHLLEIKHFKDAFYPYA